MKISENAIKLNVFDVNDIRQYINHSKTIESTPVKNDTDVISVSKNNTPVTTYEAFEQSGLKDIIKRRGPKKALSEEQLDIFGFNDLARELKKDKDLLVNKDNDKLEAIETVNFLGSFDSATINVNKDHILISLKDNNENYGTDSFDIKMPIVSVKHNLVAFTIDDVESSKDIDDKAYDNAMVEIYEIFEHISSAITKEGKPSYFVYANNEADHVDGMQEIAKELKEITKEKGESLRFTESAYSLDDIENDGRLKRMTMMLSEKASKGLTENYGNNHNTEIEDKKIGKLTVDTILIEKKEYGVKDLSTVVIYPQPWMAKTPYQAAFYTRLNDIIENKCEVKDLLKKLDTPNIKKPEFKTENIEKTKGMTMGF